MKFLALLVLVFALAATGVAFQTGEWTVALLAAFSFICAATTFLSHKISSFLKLFVVIFAVELIIFGVLHLAGEAGFWPSALADYSVPSTFPETVALFGILVYAVSHIPLLQKMMRITDRYFDAPDRRPTRIWPFPAFVALERRVAYAMIFFLVLVNQAQVAISVRLSFFSRDFFNAIQAKNEPEFWHQLLAIFLPWALVYIASQVIEYVVQSTLVIKWRRWLTDFYVNHWLGDHAHYQMSLAGSGVDNPDQRISEDISRFIDGGQTGYGIYSFTIALISQLTTLVSFSILLWQLSSSFILPYTNIALPGFLFWVALFYAAVGTIITHLIGRPLVGLSFTRQRYEADFRFSLARLREYSEQVALLDGEPAEKSSLGQRFASIVKNYYEIVACRKLLTAFTGFYGQISTVIPWIAAAPFYFAGKIELGIMSQTARAFGSVNESLNFFVTYYVSLADFKSVLDRLISFEASIEKARSYEVTGGGAMHAIADGDAIGLEGLYVRLPDGRLIVESKKLQLAANEAVLLSGPSGSGKSTFFRAISGIWPYARGKIETPSEARVMLLPQHPYIPIGTLRAAITYPATDEHFGDAAVKDAITAAGLGALVDMLDVEDAWSQRLSGGELQRLAIARVLLARPDWLFLDEATAAMDEEMEKKTYEVLREKLPGTTIVSIGHRATLAKFHKRRLVMTATEAGAFSPRDIPREAAE